jgi:hypothetical protein
MTILDDDHQREAESGRRSVHAHLAVLLAVLMAGVAACTWSRAPEAARRADRSAQVLATETVSRRVRDLVIDSPALDRYAMVRLLLPRRFEAEPGRRWPVLWLRLAVLAAGAASVAAAAAGRPAPPVERVGGAPFVTSRREQWPPWRRWAATPPCTVSARPGAPAPGSSAGLCRRRAAARRQRPDTHAITIAASADAVWPWLVQMGWGRAGWYTYRWVDRLLFPANGPSADQLLSQHQ